MDIFDFEELVAEMLNITDEQREDDDFLPEKFYQEFNIELDDGFVLAKSLLLHTPIVRAGISGDTYHAFISSVEPVMLMKTKCGD